MSRFFAQYFRTSSCLSFEHVSKDNGVYRTSFDLHSSMSVHGIFWYATNSAKPGSRGAFEVTTTCISFSSKPYGPLSNLSMNSSLKFSTYLFPLSHPALRKQAFITIKQYMPSEITVPRYVVYDPSPWKSSQGTQPNMSSDFRPGRRRLAQYFNIMCSFR